MRQINVAEIGEEILLKARMNMLQVRANVVKKLASSSTSAQGHLNLLTSITSDLKVVDDLLSRFNVAETPIVKPKQTRITKAKDKE